MKEHESVRWRPWCQEAFEEAQQEEKPIFLCISAVWCHWCHVLDEESFTHPEVIRRLNGDFIPIRIDSDKRPDINSRYNMGGWPTVVILNSQGEAITGGTYMPASQLLSMLFSVRKESIKVARIPLQPSVPKIFKKPVQMDENIIQTIAGFLERFYDPDFGGFGGPPKFPQVWAVELLLQLHERIGNRRWLEMATRTLENMKDGALYDPIDGGFFRYSASSDWESPHYEKLLDLNAQMLSLYLKAYLLTGEIAYRSTAQGVLEYLFSTLAVEGQAWFCGSQSADRGYYHQEEEQRLQSDPPPLDRTLYTDRNAVLVSALFLAHHVLGNPMYHHRALELIDFLWKACYRAGQGMFHYVEEKPLLAGYLSDQVYMMTALLDAFETTGVQAYLRRAEELAGVMQDQLWDPDAGGYKDIPIGAEAVGALKAKVKLLLENALAAIGLIRLSYLTNHSLYKKRIDSVLAYLSTIYLVYKHHGAPFGLALERFFTLRIK